jgi:hypothetical protein
LSRIRDFGDVQECLRETEWFLNINGTYNLPVFETAGLKAVLSEHEK